MSYNNSEFDCTSCLTGFTLIDQQAVGNRSKYCYPIDSTLNCTTLNASSLQSGGIVCETCDVTNQIPKAHNVVTDAKKTICM